MGIAQRKVVPSTTNLFICGILLFSFFVYIFCVITYDSYVAIIGAMCTGVVEDKEVLFKDVDMEISEESEVVDVLMEVVLEKVDE